jgi:hypothetical protein
MFCSLAALLYASSCLAQEQGPRGPFVELAAIIDGPDPAEPSTPAFALDEIERIALAENLEIHVPRAMWRWLKRTFPQPANVMIRNSCSATGRCCWESHGT